MNIPSVQNAKSLLGQSAGMKSPMHYEEARLTDGEIRAAMDKALREGQIYGDDDEPLPEKEVAIAQLAKAAPIVAARARKAERERYNEAVVLIAEVAGLNQSCWQTEDIYALENRAEEILQDLKGEKP